MNICILAPENSPSWGGVGSYVYNLAKNLPKNLDIHIVTIDRDIDDPYEKLLPDERFHIHKIIHIDRSDSFFFNLKFQLAVLRKLKKIHKQINFDLIHSHSGHLPHLFSEFQKIAPLVVTVHTTAKGVKQSLAQSGNRGIGTERYLNLFSRFIEIGEKINFIKADKLIHVSKYTLQHVCDLYSIDVTGKSSVIYNAVNPGLFRPKDSNSNISKEPVLLFAGRFISIKGFDTYLSAILELARKGYKLKPFLVGQGARGSIERIISSNFSNFEIRGIVPYGNMPQVYHKSDVVIVPSMHDNCPGIILEAMSCGKIVVASNVGGIPEIIENGVNGFLFEKEKPMELVNILVSIFEGNFNLDIIRKNAIDTIVKHFNWGKKGKEICNLYKSVIK